MDLNTLARDIVERGEPGESQRWRTPETWDQRLSTTLLVPVSGSRDAAQRSKTQHYGVHFADLLSRSSVHNYPPFDSGMGASQCGRLDMHHNPENMSLGMWFSLAKSL
ncbi:unnamed protein product [Lepidochelys kempii]